MTQDGHAFHATQGLDSSHESNYNIASTSG
jgi:hypothetical protein